MLLEVFGNGKELIVFIFLFISCCTYASVLVHGAAGLPNSVKPVLKTNAHKPPNRGPEMKAVLEELKAHGIAAEGKSFEVSLIYASFPCT